MEALQWLARPLLESGAASIVTALVVALSIRALVREVRARRREASLSARGSIIVVTGASSGIGAAFAVLVSKLAPRSTLVLVARTASRLEAVATLARANRGPGDGDVLVRALDCSSGDALLALSAELGPVTAVVASAGAGAWVSILETASTPAVTDSALMAPLASTLHTARAFLPPMLRGVGGTLVVVQSPASRVVWPGATTYTAARWGLRGAVISMRADIAAAAAVAEGATDTRVCEVILGETASEYFTANGVDLSRRLPTIAWLFGGLTVEQAAVGIWNALRNGDATTGSPWQIGLTVATLADPREWLFSFLLYSFGWRARTGEI